MNWKGGSKTLSMITGRTAAPSGDSREPRYWETTALRAKGQIKQANKEGREKPYRHRERCPRQHPIGETEKGERWRGRRKGAGQGGPPPPAVRCSSGTPGTAEVHMAENDVAVLAFWMCCEKRVGSRRTCMDGRERQEPRKT